MIHGMWGGPWVWQSYQDAFEARGYRCIATTLPFHEGNRRLAPDPRLATASLVDYVDALAKEIAALDEKPIVMGHSMGGLLAQMLAARGLASAAVLLTPAAPAGIFALKWSVMRSFRRLLLVWAFWKKAIPTTFADTVYSTLHLMPPAAQRDIFNRLTYESGRVIFEIGFWLLDSSRAAIVDAAAVTCPLLVIGAAEDRIVPASVVRQVAQKYAPLATYHEFSGHAHWVLGEPGWEAIAGDVADWLENLPQRT